MVSRNCRPGRPVKTGRLPGLPGIGRWFTPSRLMPRTRCSPEPLQDGAPLGIERLDRAHGDVAVLGIEPRRRPTYAEHKTEQCYKEPHERALQRTGAQTTPQVLPVHWRRSRGTILGLATRLALESISDFGELSATA